MRIYSFALLRRQTQKKSYEYLLIEWQAKHVRRMDYLVRLLAHLGADYRRIPDAEWSALEARSDCAPELLTREPEAIRVPRLPHSWS